MKRHCIALSLLCCFCLFSGCSTVGASTPSSAADETQEESVAARTQYAKIKTIYGNEITVVFASSQRQGGAPSFQGSPGESMPQPPDQASSSESMPLPPDQASSSESMPQPPDGSSSESTPQRPNQGSSSESMPQRPNQGSSGESGGRPQRQSSSDGEPSGGGSQRGSSNTSQPPSSMGGAQQSTGFTFEGEEQTLIIPVSAKITSGTGQSAQEIRFTQLAGKNVILLSYDESDALISIAVVQ